ncbi:MAG TPA: xanthine dehydrogenase family protein molybdopterin-binding subunit [Acidimicrobiales bacterium]
MTAVDERPAAASEIQGVGERVPRVNGPQLVTGRGAYLADHNVPGLHHVAICRSTISHARIRGIDTSEARQQPGVIAVVTEAELDAAGARKFNHMIEPPAQPLEWTILASDRVRFVGEPVAAVVARSRAEAEDAAETVVIDYEMMPAVVSTAEALLPGAPLLYPEWGTNEFLRLSGATPGFEDAMAAAPRRVTDRYESHRICGLPLEGHGAQGQWDRGTGRLTLLSSNQQPHQLRTVVAEVCGLDESKVRVISPDMGGGFGNKQHFTREECLVGMLALITEVPVRWSQDRTEALTASVHSRAQLHEVEAGFDHTGRILALRARIVSDLGNPVLYFSGAGPGLVAAGCISGGYAIDNVSWELSCVATTTCPIGAYRGFGQPEAHLTTERVMDRIAAELGLDPVEVRRLNLTPDEVVRPWWGHGGARMDPGPLRSLLDRLVDEFDYPRWRAWREAARGEGRLVGLGFSTLVQGTTPTQNDVAGRFGSIEMASITVLPDGHIDVRVGTKSQGQAHETVFAQLAASALGMPLARVAVRDGDTDSLPFGMGTWGSRSAVMGGGAVMRAARQLRAKMQSIALRIGEPFPEVGAVSPSVFDRVASVAWWHPHLLGGDLEPGLTAQVVYTPGFTGPSPGGGYNHDETYGAHATAAAVEVDPVTGAVRIRDVVMVSDCGVVINPAAVEGQHQGGFTQGLGAALFEEVRYDDQGQPLASTLMDYLIPTANDAPRLRVVLRPTPSESEGGFRGVGEASIIAAPAVLASAVSDALSPLGVRITSSRLHAKELRAAIRRSGWRADPVAWAAAPEI